MQWYLYGLNYDYIFFYGLKNDVYVFSGLYLQRCLHKWLSDITFPTLEISRGGWTKLRQLRLWLKRTSSHISILNINECLIWGGERNWPFLPHYTSDESNTHKHNTHIHVLIVMERHPTERHIQKK